MILCICVSKCIQPHTRAGAFGMQQIQCRHRNLAAHVYSLNAMMLARSEQGERCQVVDSGRRVQRTSDS